LKFFPKKIYDFYTKVGFSGFFACTKQTSNETRTRPFNEWKQQNLKMIESKMKSIEKVFLSIFIQRKKKVYKKSQHIKIHVKPQRNI
jgi:hypothetical protein